MDQNFEQKMKQFIIPGNQGKAMRKNYEKSLNLQIQQEVSTRSMEIIKAPLNNLNTNSCNFEKNLNDKIDTLNKLNLRSLTLGNIF